MSFYRPLTLGTRRSRSVRPEPEDGTTGRNEERPRGRHYDSWREGVQRLDHDYEEQPEAHILGELRNTHITPGNRFWLILGEPGAGKSTLMNAWFSRWAAELGSPFLGMSVPILVRLRELTISDVDEGSAGLADRMWALGVEAKAQLSGGGDVYYKREWERMFLPVWLLDGIDELSRELLDESLFEKLANLPGLKVLTCRTAVYESLRRHTDRYKDREYEVLGLKPTEQVAFLAQALQSHVARAGALHNIIQGNVQIRQLAVNPLMLGLIAKVAHRISLPATRAAFYQEAVQAMWQLKLEQRKGQYLTLSARRDAVLAFLAAKMGMERVEGSLSLLMETVRTVDASAAELLVEWFERSGILWFDRRRESFGFLHLTFQEYYLARSLMETGLRPALERYWADVRYEETLGLLVSLLLEQERYDEVEKGIAWLVGWGEKTHRRDPEILWKLRRSPLEVALHVLGRSGSNLDSAPTRPLLKFLWERVATSDLCKLRLAADRRIPVQFLMRLLPDTAGGVQGQAQGNSSASAEILAQLIADTTARVRRQGSGSVNMSAEVLARVAVDGEKYVRWQVAGNIGTPPEVLGKLAADDARGVRWQVARNGSTPAEVLARLAADTSKYVRWQVAENASTPPEVLALLAADRDPDVRMRVAGNVSTPAEVLARLATEGDVVTRWQVAGHVSTPAEVLAQLAADETAGVRKQVAGNVSTPAEVLARLARDRYKFLRWQVAGNPSTPLKVLALLADDWDADVRRQVARNASTLLEDLESTSLFLGVFRIFWKLFRFFWTPLRYFSRSTDR